MHSIHHRLVRSLLVLLFPVTVVVVAEQRFYQVMGADGRMQTIMMPDEPSEKDATGTRPATVNPAKVVKADEEDKHHSTPDAQPDSPSGMTPPIVAPENAVQLLAPPAPTRGDNPSATVEEDDYVDSERLEREGFNIEKKKRFYLLNDGMGRFVEEVQGGGLTDMGNQSTPTPTVDEQDIVARWTNDPVELTNEKALAALRNGKPVCLSKKELSAAERVQKGAMRAVRADAKAWQLMKEGDVLQLFAVEGEGLKKLSLSSYSRKEKFPSFFMPVIAVADSNGCMTRAVTSGYLDRWVGATKTRQHSVQGSFILLSGDRYVMVLLPSKQQAATSFPLSPFGEVAIHWHE